MLPTESAVSKVARRLRASHCRRRYYAESVSLIALAITTLSPSYAQAGSYTASNETELRARIADANADGDPTATITLTGNISITDPASFPAFIKPTTIDVGAFQLSGQDIVSGYGVGGTLNFAGGATLTTSGTLRGGNADTSPTGGAGVGGTGAALANGSVTNAGTILGGAGGGAYRQSAGAAGIGANLSNSTLVNQGTIAGGAGGNAEIAGFTGYTTARVAGAGGDGLVMTGGSLDNQGDLRGGDGGNVTGTVPSTDNFYGGVGGAGARLTGGNHINSGSIAGGQGGTGRNVTGSTIGAVSGGNGLILEGGATFVNDGTIAGGRGRKEEWVARGSSGGVGAAVSNSTFVNNSSIVGGDGESSGAGGIGATFNNSTFTNAGSITGGSSDGFGAGGLGLDLTNGSTATNSGTVVGGSGGSTGSFGAGNTGIRLSNSTITNTGAILGGNGGGGTAGGGWAIQGLGNSTVITSGTISGGVSGNGVQNQAIAFGGGNNRLELHDGFTINGVVAATATDILALGGAQDSSFAASDVGLAAQYRGFGRYQKVGTSVWSLTGTTTATTPWEIFSGTLSVAEDASLGAVAGGLTLSGGTLQNTSAFATTRAITINAAGGTIETNADLTLSGAISGAGALIKTGGSALILTAANTYSGGTVLDDGVLSVSGDANLGNAAGGLTFSGGTLRNTSGMSSARSITLDAGGGTFEALADLTLSGVVSGIGSLDKAGLGTLILSGDNSYSGATTVSAGTLLVIGNQVSATGDTTVQNGATLGGTGRIGGDVVIEDGATLSPGPSNLATGTLTINGNLALGAGSILDFNLGQAYVAGGALNDLVNVGGNLTLDGTLNVVTTAGGSFDTGIYRIFNYSGSLTNNTLDIGTIPSPDFYVQTSIANQVNLVNTSGLALRYWDGDAGTRNNGVPEGGNGTWQNVTGNDNWVDVASIPNAAFDDGAFAVFMGASGTVTVDDNLGPINASGMQFMTDGYLVRGDAINLVGTSLSDIRVGDGTTAGAAITTTIQTELTGTSGLNKTDLGTLVLSGINSYTGGTRFGGGAVQISEDGNLGLGGLEFDGGILHTTDSFDLSRAITVSNGGGGFKTDAETLLRVNSALTGSGALQKSGAGTLQIVGGDSRSGSTTIAEGIMQAGAAEVFSASSDYVVDADGTLDLSGFGQTISGLENAGNVRLGTAPGTTLNIGGDYIGAGGTIHMNAQLGGDSSPADLVAISGSTSGTSRLAVDNVGGTGAPTIEGIKIVDVAGASNGSFSLLGDYVFESDQAVVGGAYAYRLYRNGVSTPSDGDWYLRSSLIDPGSPMPPGEPPSQPLYQPGVPLYESYANILQSFNELGTLEQRVGNRSWSNGNENVASGQEVPTGTGIWGRIEAAHANFDPDTSTTNAEYDVTTWKLQAGVDGLLSEAPTGSLIGGITVHYGTAAANIDSIYGAGEIDTVGYGIGGTLTWYGNSGFYIDGQTQFTWYDTDITSRTAGIGLSEDNDGFGYSLGIEAGQRIEFGPNWSITPQAQLAYSSVDFDNFTDAFGAPVSLDQGESLKARLGISTDYEKRWIGEDGLVSRATVYSIANLYYDFLDGSKTNVAGVSFRSESTALWGGLGVGATYSWNSDKYSVYGEASIATSLSNFGDSHSLKGTVGFRVRW